jgi:SsrA-binding protein
MEINNKKAFFKFEIISTYIAGIKLVGTEIKSIRKGKCSFTDSYCYFNDGELWLKNLYISEYENGNYNNHDPKRERKLLLTKNELRRLEQKIKEKGLTIVPLKLFINDKNLAKIEIGLAKGKNVADKRETIKKRDLERQMKNDV